MRSAGSAGLAPAATMVCLRRRWSQGKADLAGEWVVDWGSRPAERACGPMREARIEDRHIPPREDCMSAGRRRAGPGKSPLLRGQNAAAPTGSLPNPDSTGFIPPTSDLIPGNLPAFRPMCRPAGAGPRAIRCLTGGRRNAAAWRAARRREQLANVLQSSAAPALSRIPAVRSPEAAAEIQSKASPWARSPTALALRKPAPRSSEWR